MKPPCCRVFVRHGEQDRHRSSTGSNVVVFCDEALPGSVSVEAPPLGRTRLTRPDMPFVLKAGDTIVFDDAVRQAYK